MRQTAFRQSRCGHGNVSADYVERDCRVQLGQRQLWRRGRFVFHQMSGQFRQKVGIQRSEQALYFAAPLWSSNGRIDNTKAQTGRYLIEMLAGEVAPMIDIEHIGDATDRPSCVTFPSDRLTQRKAGVEDRRHSEKHHDDRNGTGMIVYEGYKPRTSGLAPLIENKQIEHGVIGLLDRIGAVGAMPVN